MKKRINKYIGWVVIAVIIALWIVVRTTLTVSAVTGSAITMSPMNQSVILNPGESQKVSFRISNSAEAKRDVRYELSVEPFYMSEQNEVTYQAENDMSEIVNWVKFDVPIEGVIEPNGVEEIVFTINVPESAPAGGQYFSVMVTEKNDEESNDDGSGATGDSRSTSIKETWRMAHLIYAEVTGDIIRQGEIIDVSVPSFLLSGTIKGVASIKNTGNVHGDAIYKIQVFPLFSDEEIYTNEENPEKVTILPNRTLYHTTSWDQTPGIGIFNVVYTVEFEGSTAQVKKMVIKCPVWLLFLILFAIAAIIIYFVMRARARKGER